MLVLALVTVGWSRAGADGGGIVVLLAAFAVLAARMYGVRWTWRRAGAAVVGIVLLSPRWSASTRRAAARATSRTRSAAGRCRWPRISRAGSHISVSSLGAARPRSIVFAVSIAALVVLALLQPRFPAGDALLTGIAVSLARQRQPRPVRFRRRAVLCSSLRVRTGSVDRRVAAIGPITSESMSRLRRSHVRQRSRRASPRRSRRCSRGPGRRAPTSPRTSTSAPSSSTTASRSGTTSGTRAATASSPTACSTTRSRRASASACSRWRRSRRPRSRSRSSSGGVGPARAMVEPHLRGRLGGHRPLGRLPVRARRCARAARALGAPGAAALALRRARRR